jgi:hypothetical protein
MRGWEETRGLRDRAPHGSKDSQDQVDSCDGEGNEHDEVYGTSSHLVEGDESLHGNDLPFPSHSLSSHRTKPHPLFQGKVEFQESYDTQNYADDSACTVKDEVTYLHVSICPRDLRRDTDSRPINRTVGLESRIIIMGPGFSLNVTNYGKIFSMTPLPGPLGGGFSFNRGNRKLHIPPGLSEILVQDNKYAISE